MQKGGGLGLFACGGRGQSPAMSMLSSQAPALYRLPDVVPARGSLDWLAAERHIRSRFLGRMEWLRLRVEPSRLVVLHPAQAAAVELARSLHNGEITPAEDGDGAPQPLPRVWRFECELQIFWILELCRREDVRRLVQWDRDQLAAAA